MDALHGPRGRLGASGGALHQCVAILPGDDGETRPHLVGPESPHLALVAVFERLAAAATFARSGDAFVERGDVGGVQRRE